MLPTLKTHTAYAETFTDQDKDGKFISRCRYYERDGTIVFEETFASDSNEEAKAKAKEILTAAAKDIPEIPEKELVSISKDDIGVLTLSADEEE